MKKLLYGVTTALVVVATTVVYYGCNKDGENSLVKQHKCITEDELWEFEKYTPAESTISEKLHLLNNYVNLPNEYSMPNIELKEAVWFLEAYFNIGVCHKQKHPMKYAEGRKKYFIDIPFERLDSTDGEEILILDGNALQQEYISLLGSIVNEVCTEYAINFGNVFVQSINADGFVRLGIEVLYGPKDCEIFRIYQVKKIVDPTTNMIYPTDAPQHPSPYENINQYEL